MKVFWFIPFISSLIGWLTNFIAIKMLFRPHKLFKIGPFSFQGLVPKRKERIARSISETVELHLFNKEDIKKVSNQNSIESFLEIIEVKIDNFIETRLFSFSPMVAAFINDDLKQKIKKVLLKEVINMLPDISEKLQDNLEKTIDIKEIVYQKILAFDFIKLENIIVGIASKELRAIELWGAFLGFIIGLVQILILTYL